jgi:hypothetical protein
MKNKSILFILFAVIIVVLFGSWFSSSGTLSAGDWLYKFPLAFQNYSFYPYVWDPLSFSKLGENNILQVPLNTYYLGSGFLVTNILHFSWNIYERLIWFFPFLILSFFSSRYLFKNFFPDLDEIYSLICSLVFMTNTYVLMMVGGGQIGVGVAYSLVPFIFIGFIKIINSFQTKTIVKSVITGLLLSLLVFLDLRFAYLVIIAVILVTFFLTHFGYCRFF